MKVQGLFGLAVRAGRDSGAASGSSRWQALVAAPGGRTTRLT